MKRIFLTILIVLVSVSVCFGASTKISPDVAIGSGGAAVTLGSGAVGTLY